jgi:hypothetical protein
LIAGGDLDGDQFFVSWHEVLIKIKPIEPQPPVQDQGHINKLNVVPEDKREIMPRLVELFLQQLFNVAIGRISNMHQAIADKAPDGAHNRHCLELSELFMRSVDAAKTGDLINIDKFAREGIDPGQPHFMKDDDEAQTYGNKGTFHSKGTHASKTSYGRLANMPCVCVRACLSACCRRVGPAVRPSHASLPQP